MEDTEVGVEPEVAAPDQEYHEDTVEQAAPRHFIEEDPQERNWKQARQVMQEQKRQIEELASQLNQMKHVPQQPEEEELDDHEFIRASHLKKYHQKLQNELAQKNAELAIERLRMKYSDFDEVVSEPNLRQLRENEPEIAQSLLALQGDPVAQATAAYKMLKKLEYSGDAPMQSTKKRIQENLSKPGSAQGVKKTSALSDANRFSNGLTSDLKKSLYDEMQQCRRRG